MMTKDENPFLIQALQAVAVSVPVRGSQNNHLPQIYMFQRKRNNTTKDVSFVPLKKLPVQIKVYKHPHCSNINSFEANAGFCECL